MLINARDRFIDRMAATMAATRYTDTAAQAKERFAGFDPLDKANARVKAAALPSESPKTA